MKISQTTPAAAVVEPVGIADLRDHLRLEHSDDDPYLFALAAAARQAAESHIDAIIAPRAFLLTLDSFPEEIEIPVGPVQAATVVIQYYNAQNALTTFADFDYYTINDTLFLVPNPGVSWPSTASGKDRVRVTFTAGHASPPMNIRHAIKMIAGTLYDQRRDVTAQTMALVPMSSQLLLEPFRRSVA